MPTLPHNAIQTALDAGPSTEPQFLVDLSAERSQGAKILRMHLNGLSWTNEGSYFAAPVDETKAALIAKLMHESAHEYGVAVPGHTSPIHQSSKTPEPTYRFNGEGIAGYLAAQSGLEVRLTPDEFAKFGLSLKNSVERKY